MSHMEIGKRSFHQNVVAYLDANPDENDVTFLVGPHEEEVDALQLALKASCPAFDKLFEENWGTERLKEKRLIPLPELDPTAFRMFLQVILWDEWSVDVFERMDLKPDTISHLIDLSYQLDMPELHKIFYSLKRFPSLTSNPASSPRISNQDKSRKVTTCTQTAAVSGIESHQPCTLDKNQSRYTMSKDKYSKSVQHSKVIAGSDVINIINAHVQNQPPPVTTFVEIDSPTHNFTGREDLLQLIHSRMKECSTQRHYAERIVVLCGLGGIGKTEVARMYAYSNIYDDIIQNVAWINAETETSLKTSFDFLAKKLKLPLSSDLLETVNLVYTHFSDYVRTGLFIFDNAPMFNERQFGIHKFLPVQVLENVPLILITSRERDWKIPKENIILVENLNENESFELIVKILHPSFDCYADAHISAMNQLVEAFQGFPLGISLAAGNIRYIDETDFNEEIENYVRRMNLPLGGWVKDEPTSLATRYKLIMENVWDISLEKIQAQGKDGRVAIHLLNFMAYLPTNGITVQLMSDLYYFMYSQRVTKKNFFILEDKSMASVARISTSLNFSKCYPCTKARITIHRLVQRITREKLDARKDYFYLSEICDYLANMKLLGNDNYSDDAILSLHHHLKVRKWPHNFIRYSVIFCSFMTFFESQNLESLNTIGTDVYEFLGIQNVNGKPLEETENAVNLYTLCCLWIHNSLEKSVEQIFVKFFLHSKSGDPNFEFLFRSLKASSPNNGLVFRMDLPFVHQYLYNCFYQRVSRFLASQMQYKISSATDNALFEYESSIRQVVHENTFTTQEILERESKIAEKHPLDKFYVLCESAPDYDLQVYTDNLLQMIQTKLYQFHYQNHQNKFRLEENIQHADRCFSKAVNYNRLQMMTCKQIQQFQLLHSPAKQRAIQLFQKSKSIPDKMLAQRLVSLRAEISSIRTKTLCSLSTELSISLADSKINTSTFSPSMAMGIDFGTTSCSVAILRHPKQMPEVLKNEFGQNKTPSYVSYVLDEKEGRYKELTIFAGNTAKELRAKNPEFTVSDIKRFIGRSFHDPRIQKNKQLWPFNVVDHQGFVGVKGHRETLHPLKIAKQLISHLKKEAEEALGVVVHSTVVAVPVYFTDVHMQLTHNACLDAGFENIQFIAEPVAAAVACGLQTPIQSKEAKTCLIYDLGGGTFNVSVFLLDARRQVDVRATGGDDHLGGEDFTDLLTEFCIDEFRRIYDVDLAEGKSSDDAAVRRNTTQRLGRIRDECEVQKCNLALLQSVVVSLDNIHEELNLFVSVTRSKFEGLIDALLKQSINILDDTLTKSGFKKEEIDDVILIGGSSQMPKVQQMVQEYFAGKQICRTIDTDEAVACGAAVHAYNVFKENATPFSVVTLLEKIRWGYKVNGFPRRSEHAAATVGSAIYSFGGQGSWNDSSYSRDVLDVFVLNVDDREDEWKKLEVVSSEVSPNQRSGHSAVAHKEFVLIFGGFNRKKYEWSNSTYLFNTETRKWEKPKVTGKCPGPRDGHSVVVVRNEMYIYGGSRVGYGVINQDGYGDLHSLHLETFRWSLIETKGIPPIVRNDCSATVHNDRCILIFGGFDRKKRKIGNTTHSFDVDNKTWTEVETRGTPPPSREDHCAFVHNQGMYIFGGRDENKFYLDDLFTFDAETFEWKKVNLNGKAPSPRSRAGCVAVNDQVFIFGGYRSNAKYLEDTYVLEI